MTFAIMVYTMRIYVDGGCRGNGGNAPIAAAAAVFKNRGGGGKSWSMALPQDPRPTNQRAEILAIVLALEKALEIFRGLSTNPAVDVQIYSDSRYAVGCMTEWIYKWSQNGWVNAAGHPVANRDLIQEASDLDDDLRREGRVGYTWIPREQNQEADRACNDCMDREEQEYDRQYGAY
jgi:ribonuclease HI